MQVRLLLTSVHGALIQANMSDVLASFGDRLLWARTAVALSGRDLERLAGIGESNVYQIETRGRIPGADIVVRIAAVLGTTTDWLLTGAGDAPTAESMAVAVVRARGKV